MKEGTQLFYILADANYDSGRLFNIFQHFYDDSYSTRFNCGIV